MRASTVPSGVSVSGRRALGAVLATMILGGALVAPAEGATRPAPVRTLTDSDCAVALHDAAAAVSTAVRCGREVEVLDERTEWQTVHALPDGQMRLDTSVSAQRTQVAGEWTEIDTTLVEGVEGIGPVAPAVEMVFSDGTPGQPLARLRREGHELIFDVPFNLGAPVVYGTTLEYRGVLPGVDLLVTVDEDGSGFTEVLRLESPEAAADPRISELTFPVAVSDGLHLVDSEHGFAATDASGQAVFASLPPVMWDSSADLSAPILTPRVSGMRMMAADDGTVLDEGVLANRAARQDAPLEGDRAASMDIEVAAGGDAVVVTPDPVILTDPATVWPVYIDPPIKGSLSGYISMRNDGWSEWNYAGDRGVGHCGTTGSPMFCSKVFTLRAAWQFVGLGAVGGVEPGDVTAAVFSVYGTHSYSCTPYPVEAWWTGGITSGTTRSTLNWARREQTQSLAHRPSCGNDRTIEFNVLEAGRDVARYNGDSLTLGLKAENESSSTGWKRYRGSDATLSITYNTAPRVPTEMVFTNPAAGCGTVDAPSYLNTLTGVKVSAILSDPENDPVQPNWGVFNSADPATVANLLASGRLPAVDSGTRATVPVDLPADKVIEGSHYRFQMNAVDPSVVGGVAAPCEFVLDLTPPAAPTVAAVPGGAALYVEGAVSGAPEAPGWFQFSSASTDVVRYVYSINSPTYELTAPPGSSPIIVGRPPSAGWYTIFVRAVDRAGNFSEATYEFGVAAAGTSVWLIEQPSAGDDQGSSPGQRPLTSQGGPEWENGREI